MHVLLLFFLRDLFILELGYLHQTYVTIRNLHFLNTKLIIAAMLNLEKYCSINVLFFISVGSFDPWNRSLPSSKHKNLNLYTCEIPFALLASNQLTSLLKKYSFFQRWLFQICSLENKILSHGCFWCSFLWDPFILQTGHWLEINTNLNLYKCE